MLNEESELATGTSTNAGLRSDVEVVDAFSVADPEILPCALTVWMLSGNPVIEAEMRAEPVAEPMSLVRVDAGARDFVRLQNRLR
jgi:hypothetical protein